MKQGSLQKDPSELITEWASKEIELNDAGCNPLESMLLITAAKLMIYTVYTVAEDPKVTTHYLEQVLNSINHNINADQ
jgi:hypothetical protein